ncbi:MAG: hypothetical protein OZ914_01855 [Anaerolineaceae bacterium]|nr:hypothetical protein [Anaerolineaceae bacterium]
MPTFDLHILPIRRMHGQTQADMPGLLALTPARKVARGREKDSLIVYLALSNHASLSNAELAQVNHNAADVFYQTPGSLTSAMRKAADYINAALFERNRSAGERGQYTLGFLALAAVRESQFTLLLSGPMRAIWTGEGPTRQVYDPALSGKGVGASQNFQFHFSQLELHPNDLVILCATFPKDWETDLLGERPPASFDAMYRKLTFAKGDLHAALIQPQPGRGLITILRVDVGDTPPEQTRHPVAPMPPDTESVESPQESANAPVSNIQPDASSNVSISSPPITEEQLDTLADFGAHFIQASASAPLSHPTATPPLSPDEIRPSAPRNFPSSIPRAASGDPEPLKTDIADQTTQDDAEEEDERPVNGATPANVKADTSDAHKIVTRQMAKMIVGVIQTARNLSARLGDSLQRFIPRLLPGAESSAKEGAQQPMLFAPTHLLSFIAVAIPVLIATIGVVVYLRSGQGVQYSEYYRQAQNEVARALSEKDPLHQRDAWEKSLELIDQAETYGATEQSGQLRQMAQANLDALMGMLRLEFIPAFTGGLGNDAHISRMAANESNLYMLEATRGEILHASFTGRGLELDASFKCQPGSYAGYKVGALVDLAILPKVNLVSAAVMGVDAEGNLLYCAPGQAPQVLPLPALPNTDWERITGFALDSDTLYVLDASARSVWVYQGQESAFTSTPYFYFSNQIPTTLDTAIDIAVSGDDLYLLHADGHISTCTFSRISQTPTKCADPLNFADPFPAHQDRNIFAQAHFTRIALTALPNSVLLLLDAENRTVFRFTPRSLELQNQLTGFAGKDNPFQAGSIDAMTVSPNYVLYLAIGNQIYFATNLP